MSHKMKICTYVLICRVEIVLSVYVVNQGIEFRASLYVLETVAFCCNKFTIQ